MLFHPEAASAIDLLPPVANRILALGVLGVLGAYIAWVWRGPRTIGRSHWRVALPSGPSTLLQISIGIIDLSFCALAMYMLVPTDPNIGFITVSVIFVSATLLGFASHAPGGLGVFDAAMLVALWQFDKEDLVAGLLLFRLLYYIVPFIITLVILGSREARLSFAGRNRAEIAAKPPISAHAVAPDVPLPTGACEPLARQKRVVPH
jgi:uncharacterized membrane protein YbhN (UPF0104 family)